MTGFFLQVYFKILNVSSTVIMFFKIYFCGTFICQRVCVEARGFMWRSKVNLHESVLSFHHVSTKTGLRFSSFVALALSLFLLSDNRLFYGPAVLYLLTYQLNDTGLIPHLTITNTVAMNIHMQAFMQFCAPILGSHMGMKLLSDLLHIWNYLV